ncbi:hypothetical protein JDV02_006779 [Purpureocillium takamizusanense]|uniref:Kinetochore protein mis13 n=1 Tax=Purpureocillium takamizusanense TaxID=2060973 RepID=A0A9Q8QL10_9HYPO|nr:uncharacterized protein JDV02_006779 [Purpureocillium takamizusanense]UNI20714.1 hypothetical protein JDV02_006779 [Purpureocillium takamizusanense]
MTTLVATRQALELLSMSDQQKRRTSKRLAAAADYEQDDDFQFVRKSKRPKTEEEKEPPKKTGRGRASAKDKAARELSAISESPKALPSVAAATTTTTTTGTRKSSRRKQNVDAPEEPQQQPQKRATRQSKRLSGDSNVEEPKANGASRKQGRGKGRPPRVVLEEEPEEEVDEVAASPPTPPAPVESTKIALPMSDTPIINRNKDMRKKGNSNRRSSLGSRGRRASSLIESGQSAIPHREVDPAEFYKHIEADLVEPRRMKQLLMWCGERALSAKPPLGTPNSDAILGARAIQDQILRDFASRSEFSDWFSRDDAEPRAKVVLKPNPRNIEMDEKLASLQEKIDRLRREKEAWLLMKKLPPEQPPLFSADEPDQIVLPDFDLLDEDDGKLRGQLADEANSSAALRSRTELRLKKIQSSLEFQIDQFADNVHKLEQRVQVAGKEADRVLKLSAVRLREREQREKTSAGTRDMPIMEVLRSLGQILPEGNGG